MDFWLQINQFRYQGRLTITNYISKTNCNKKEMRFIQASPKHGTLSDSTPTQTTWTLRYDLFSAFTELAGGSARNSLVLFLLHCLCPVPLLLFAKGQFLAPAHSSVSNDTTEYQCPHNQMPLIWLWWHKQHSFQASSEPKARGMHKICYSINVYTHL